MYERWWHDFLDDLVFKGSPSIIHKSILEHSLNFFKHLSERVKLINNTYHLGDISHSVSATTFSDNFNVPKRWRENIFKRIKSNDGIIYDWDLASVPDCSKNKSYISHHLLLSMECNLHDQMLFFFTVFCHNMKRSRHSSKQRIFLECKMTANHMISLWHQIHPEIQPVILICKSVCGFDRVDDKNA